MSIKEAVRVMLRRLPPWLLTSLTVLAILYLTLMPHPLPDNDIHLFAGADKVVHAVMFGGLYLMMWADRARRGQSWRRCRAMVMAAVAIAFGGLIELIQQWMGMGRGCELADWAADAAGVIIIYVVIKIAAPRCGDAA